MEEDRILIFALAGFGELEPTTASRRRASALPIRPAAWREQQRKAGEHRAARLGSPLCVHLWDSREASEELGWSLGDR